MPPARHKAILLFGIPGSGKGTQGAILGTVPGLVHLAMGDIFRALDRQSDLGRKFLSYSTKGELVPDDLTIEIWKRHVDQLVAGGKFRPANEFLLLDGIPRSPAQANSLDGLVDVMLILHLICRDENEMVGRMRQRALKQSRPDDADEKVIRRRFEVYKATTEPVLGHYPKTIVRDVEASGTPARVLHTILGAVAPLQESVFPNPLG